jgi:hypothetical protein
MNSVLKISQRIAPRSIQTGAATISMAVVLLLLITMVGIYTSRTVNLEEKISGNDFRTRQAFEAAESGLQIAMAYISRRGGADKNDDGILDGVFDTDGDGIGDVNTMTFENFSSTTVTLTGAFPRIAIQADGFSDDRTATRTVHAVGSTVDALPNAPSNPFTSKGTVVIGGSATVHNPEGSSTIWSGSDVNLGSNNATATNIADPSDANYPVCMDTPMTCSLTRSSTKVSVGLDVIEYDSSIANLTAEQMFENFFGLSSANYRESRVTLEVAAANANNLASNEAAPGVHLSAGEVIWVDGNADLSNTTTVGCEVEVTGGATCPAASLDPTVLIVNGDLTADGTPNFYGIVYVIGNVNITGNSTVTGAMITAGSLANSAGGSTDIWYNSDVLNAARDNGKLSAAPGSWHDW